MKKIEKIKIYVESSGRAYIKIDDLFRHPNVKETFNLIDKTIFKTENEI
jgi:hypothetical protein